MWQWLEAMEISHWGGGHLSDSDSCHPSLAGSRISWYDTYLGLTDIFVMFVHIRPSPLVRCCRDIVTLRWPNYMGKVPLTYVVFQGLLWWATWNQAVGSCRWAHPRCLSEKLQGLPAFCLWTERTRCLSEGKPRIWTDLTLQIPDGHSCKGYCSWRDAERNAILAGDPKMFRLLCNK